MKNSTPSFNQKTSEGAARVVRRALVLAAVACRGSIDTEAGQPDVDALYIRLLEWLTHCDLWKAVEPNEETILRTPLGKLTQQEVIRATWPVEGLAVLAWAVKQFEFPKHDQKVDPYVVADAVWFLSEDAEELIRAGKLRKPMQLKACGELLYAVHVRLRDFLRHREKGDITDWIEKKWTDALRIDMASLIIDNDLAIDGKPISEADFDRVQECAWITYERHRAILWLIERSPSYAHTPVDT